MLTQAWVNDAAYFDGTGFAEIVLAEESGRMQRFEQEVKLLSHKGILLLLHSEVKTSLIHSVSELFVNFAVGSLMHHSIPNVLPQH